MNKLKEYTSNVVIVYSINCHEAENIEDYKKKVKLQYKEMHDIDLVDSEIQDIEMVNND
tara:strand:- start:1088 stop:1264 length:177 start_codon:yes stop_codon:yes gene_type:complete